MPIEFFDSTRGAGKAVSGGTVGSGFSRQTQDASNGGFADALGRLIDGVEESAGQANVAVGNMLEKTGEVHDAMIALQRAEMALQLTIQIRNKLVTAYQDIMRMPV